ncbi:hypothetical protein [Paenirhodobacter populi]|uniref:Uncharacterized protein n=1 Tax=Paenirhodobacter populi TaxID=2306993 RepID=A0A443J0C8_9RHOB|nr:hypothetical protein [Sinirhodobacter populi]RWR13822.1 hypothetical protein D2T33_05335 [Sinirhodobacter populi]
MAVGIGMQILGGIMTAQKQKTEKPSLKDHDEPTSDAHRPIPLVAGTVKVDGLNLLFTADRNIRERMVKAPGKK